MRRPIVATAFLCAVLLAGPAAGGGLAERAATGPSAEPAALRAEVLLGESAVEHGRAMARPGMTRAFRLAAINSGTTSVAHLYVGAGSTAHLLYLGLYDDRSGRPGGLLAAGVLRRPSAGQWVAVPLAGISVTRGHHYWLAVLARGGSLRYRVRRRRSCLSATSRGSDLHSLANSWTGPTLSLRCPPSAYVTMKVAAAPSPQAAQPAPPAAAVMRGCFGREEACGYPGPNNTGVQACSALKAVGAQTLSTPGERVEGEDITGEVIVAAPDVTMNNDCVEVDGGEEVRSQAVWTEEGAGHFTISNSTIRGLNTTTESIEAAISNDYHNEGDLADGDRIENCGTCIYYDWTVENSYVNNDGLLGLDESFVNHAEPWFIWNSTIVANHDTLYNPSKQAAEIFAQGNTGEGCTNHETVINSLLAGGGYVFYFCAHTSSNAGSTIDIKDNRFARLVCKKAEIEDVQRRGGHECSGTPNESASYFDAGEGSGGYFPRGGFFGVVDEGEGLYDQGSGWEGNYWDNNLEAQPEKAYCPKCG
jgi:hypothetical protein